MRISIAVLPIVGFFAAVIAPVTASMETAADQSVTVRIYNSFGVPLNQLEAAQEIAAGIFRDARVDATWRNCRFRHYPRPVCRRACSNADRISVRPSRI